MMTEYIVHVKGTGSKIVDNKRFTAESMNDLADKVAAYFRFDFELVRLEKIEILEDILGDEEAHIDWIEAQLDQISQMGIQNYLVEQLG